MDKTRAYPATVAGVVDGDTLDVVVDLGFNRITTTERLRLDGIDAYDKPADKKREATEFATRWCGRHREVLVHTRKTKAGSDEREKYGRIVARVYSADGFACLNEDLVANGHAWKRTW